MSDEGIKKEPVVQIKTEKEQPPTPKTPSEPSVSTEIVKHTNQTKEVKKIVFSPDELHQALKPVLEKLFFQEPESMPFRQPVDPEILQIPVSLNKPYLYSFK